MYNKINVVVDVSDSFLDDILTTAFEGGSNYWLDSVTIKDKPDTPHKNLYNSEIVSRGGALLCDSVDNGSAVLTKKRLLSAIEWYIKDNGGDLDFLEDHDAQDADTILQYAVFGEVIYG